MGSTELNRVMSPRTTCRAFAVPCVCRCQKTCSSPRSATQQMKGEEGRREGAGRGETPHITQTLINSRNTNTGNARRNWERRDGGRGNWSGKSQTWKGNSRNRIGEKQDVDLNLFSVACTFNRSHKTVPTAQLLKRDSNYTIQSHM